MAAKILYRLVIITTILCWIASPALAKKPENPGSQGNKPALEKPGSKPSSEVLEVFKVKGLRKGLIKLNKASLGPGNQLEIQIVVPASLKAVWNGMADLHLVLRLPDGVFIAVPVYVDGATPDSPKTLVNIQVEEGMLAEGRYQIAMIMTEPGGDPLQLADWYNGFSGLISVNSFKYGDDCNGSEDGEEDCGEEEPEEED
jgi:hypothetical protein